MISMEKRVNIVRFVNWMGFDKAAGNDGRSVPLNRILSC